MENWLFRRFLFVFLIFSTGFSSRSHAVLPPCEITPIEGSKLSDRSRVVNFADGRVVIIIGDDHGDRDFPLKLSKLTRTKRDSIPDDEFEAQVQGFLIDGRDSVENANEDLVYLREMLSADQRLGFIGYEGTQDDAKSNFNWMLALRARVISQINQRNLRPSSTYENLVLLAAGAPMYLKIVEPALFKRCEIVGVESDDVADRYEIALNEFNSARDELKMLAKRDKGFLRKLSDTYGELMVLYPFYQPEKHDETLLAAVSERMPEKYMGAGMKWFHAALKEMNAMKARDRAIVKNMISLNESGILFIGLWHLDSIAAMLKQKCMELLQKHDSVK